MPAAPIKLFKNNANRKLIGFNLPTQSVNVGDLAPFGKAILSNSNSSFSVKAAYYGQTGIFMGLTPQGKAVFSVVGANGSMEFDGANLNVSGIISALAGVITGLLTIGKGGAIASGSTAYNVGAGLWLGTDSSGDPQISIRDTLGNFITISATGSNVLNVSSTGITGALTSKQVDDAGLGNTAIWLNLVGTPTTRAGYGITDAQATLPNATAVGQVLYRDNGGAPYFATKYGSEINIASADLTGNSAITSSTFATMGPIIGILKPSAPVSFLVIFSADALASANGTVLGVHLDYSLDGGTTWTRMIQDGPPTYTTWQRLSYNECAFNVTCTGDLQVRVQLANNSGVNSINVNTGVLSVMLIPNSNFYTISGPLAVTVPSTSAGNCTAYYPTTTCTAGEYVTVTVAGGLSPYTYSWAVVSGSGTIISGSTSQTCLVNDTETTSDAGATSNTVVACTVTDSQNYTGCTASESGTTASVTTASPHSIPVGAKITCSGFSVAGYNGTFTTIAGTAGSTIKYTTGAGLGAATGGTVGTVKVTSNNDTITNTFYRAYNNITATISPNGGTCSTPVCASTCTANGTLTANASGGNGSYTYSWTVVSGTGTIVSGSTSATVSMHDSQATSSPFPFTQSTTRLQCTVNDSRSTGAVSPQSNITLTFKCPTS